MVVLASWLLAVDYLFDSDLLTFDLVVELLFGWFWCFVYFIVDFVVFAGMF